MKKIILGLALFLSLTLGALITPKPQTAQAEETSTETTTTELSYSIENLVVASYTQEELANYKKVEIGDSLSNCTLYIDSYSYFVSEINDHTIMGHSGFLFYGNFDEEYEGDPNPYMVENKEAIPLPVGNSTHYTFDLVGDFGIVSIIGNRDVYIIKTFQPNDSESTPDESTPDESTPDENTPDESTPDSESTPDESTPDSESGEPEDDSEKFIDKTTNWINDTFALKLTSSMVGGILLVCLLVFVLRGRK